MKVIFRVVSKGDWFLPFVDPPQVLRAPDFREAHLLEYAIVDDTSVLGTDASKELLVSITEGHQDDSEVTFILARSLRPNQNSQ